MSKKIISIIMCVLLCLSSLPLMAYAEDTRTPVDTLEFSGFTAPKYGDNIDNALSNITQNYTCAEGAVYRLSRGMASLEKYIDGKWTLVSRNDGSDAANYLEKLNEGKYKFSVQVRIDGENGSLYNFAESMKVCTVNGQPSEFSIGGNYDTFSFANITFEFDIEKEVIPFSFSDSSSYDYNFEYVNEPIIEKHLQAIGGTESYVFSKVSTDCEWLNVSEDGAISGTPTKADNQTHNIDIKCTDGVDEATITIFIGKVYIAPEDREVVDTIELTGFTAPAIGEKMENTISAIMEKAECPEGTPYRIAKNMNSVSKYIDGKWTLVSSDYGDYAKDYLDSYTDGKYKVQVQVRIDGENGYNYVFANTLKSCTINGKNSNYTLGYIQDTYSYYMVEFEFEVHSFTNYLFNDDSTCTEDGTLTAKCDYCDATDTVPAPNSAKGHQLGVPVNENEIPATCTEGGSYDEVYYCPDCGVEAFRRPMTTPATGHKGTVEKFGKPATCTEDATVLLYCECGEFVEEVTVPDSSSGHYWVKKNAKAATCTEDGKEADTVCDVCGTVYSKGKAIPAKGHKEVVLKAVTATAKKSGLTEGKKCSVCGKTLTAQKMTLAQVTGLKASTVAKTSIKLSWTKIAGAKYYKVEKYDSSNKKWVAVKTVDTNSYTVSKLTAGKKYQFRVTALDSTKKIAGKASTVLKTGTLTSAPTVTVKSTKSKTAVASWKKVTGASKYIVYKSTDGKKWTKVTTTTKLTYTLTKLTGGKKIYVKVVAVNAYGKESAASKVVNTTVKK